MGIQKVSALDLDMETSMSPESNDARMKLLEAKPFEELSASERAELAAYKEENDDEHLKSVGRITPGNVPDMQKLLMSNNQQPTRPVVQEQPQPRRALSAPPATSTIQQNKTTPSTAAVPKTKASLVVSPKKDELTIPIQSVTSFLAKVMGEEFGYISKDTAKMLIDLIPKDAALLAMADDKDAAMKFLYHDDPEVVDQAIRVAFDVSNESDVNMYKKMIDMPGVTINPWI